MPVRMALLSLIAQLEPEPVGVEKAKAMVEALEAWILAGGALTIEVDADDADDDGLNHMLDVLDVLAGKGH